MPYTLTPSTLSLFRQCPRCFWLLINKNISRPMGIFSSLPHGIDKVLKERFDYFRSHEKLPPELQPLGLDVCLFDHPLLALWRKNTQGIRWKDPSGNMLRGALDDVLQKGHKLIVLEYVTRGFALKEDTLSYYQDQVNLYSYLLQKNSFPTEGYAYVLFYYPKGMNWGGDIWFHKKLEKIPISILAAEKLFQNAIAALNGEIPPASKICEYCKWKNTSK